MPLGVVAGGKTRSEPHVHPGELFCRDSGRLDVSQWLVLRLEEACWWAGPGPI